MKIVPDTSVIIDGRVSERIETGEFSGAILYLPEAVVSELEGQANHGKETGWSGLAELERLAEYATEGVIQLEYVGRPPSETEQKNAHRGEIDALIRSLTSEYDALLLTSDLVQSKVARARGIDVEYIEPKVPEIKQFPLQEYFDDQTMSLHLKAGVNPRAKRGQVGEMHYESIRDVELTDDEIEKYADQILALVQQRDDGFIELDDDGMQIIQLGEYRIAIARPPFSDGWEITAVRPLVKTSLDDYAFADELRNRFLERKRGVLIAGAPGAGKSTFAQAVAEFLSSNDFVVKTMEKPRDLQVGPEITQYTALRGKMERTADSLLLVRPDYTIYDELRRTSDFEVYSDMRMAGVGMVGVAHASRAIDALQRLLGRVEFGLIPQIVDTVVYIEHGVISKVYDVTMEVKLPQGLTEDDLARPVIMVRDFETGRPEYEIYLFSRQVVTIPIRDEQSSGVNRIASREIEREIRSIARGQVEVDLQSPNKAVVYVDENDISYVIGKGGSRIDEVEDRLGINIDVRTHDERPATEGSAASTGENGGEVVVPEAHSSAIVLNVAGNEGNSVEVKADGEYLFTATVGRNGDIQVSRGTAIAEELERAINQNQRITVEPT